MQKYLLFSLLLTSSITAMSQIHKGQFLLGGNISLESIKTEDGNMTSYKSTDFFISPDIGYFFIDKLAAGLRVDFSSYNQKLPNNGLVQSSISLSPFARYYFLQKEKKVNVFIDGSYIHSRGKYTIINSPQAYITKSNGYHISAGPSVFLSNQVSLEFIIGYRHILTDDFYNTESSTIHSGFGLQIHLGKIKPGLKK